MNSFLKILAIAVALVTAIPSFAVTDKEMEQARAIAAKHYLRYANNGSDYLDKLNPTSVGELSKSLRAKEQENIKSFNAVAVPKDYASWDKQKLVEYWSKTFFNASGLKEDGKKCLSILAKNLNKMSVAAPSETKPSEQPAAETKPAEPKPEQAAPAQNPEQAPANPTPGSTPPSAENATANEAEATDQVDAAVVQAQADAGLAEEQPHKSSNTGWYIGILVVLVGVVIWLVMYASKSMKETGTTLADHKAGEKEIREAKKAAKEELNKMREQYAGSLTSKNEEIKQLKSQCEDLDRQLSAAKQAAAAARRELEAAKHEISSLRQTLSQQKSQAAAPERPSQPKPESRPRPQSEPQRQAPQREPQEQGPAPAPKPQVAARPGGLPPVVFLSYVNQKGLFTKASRSLNPETSVYRMDIPDGHRGNFRVVNDAEILDRLIDDPEKWLAGGCVIENPEDADIAAEIVTLQTGEAVFADNTCRVTKKARIKFV
ncbi:MAG: hypothetical protein K2N25_09285 [Muribaculaceae bacterium]|nr:hypothetical protein [Muribaculaceae bacterium]